METHLITLRLPMSLIHRVDELARRRNCARSAILEEALRQFLGGEATGRSSCDMTVARDAGTDEPLYKLNEG